MIIWYDNTESPIEALINHSWANSESFTPRKAVSCLLLQDTVHLAVDERTYCNSEKQAEDCVQAVSFCPTNTQSLVYGLWEFTQSASLEGYFVIQMPDRREGAEGTWTKGTRKTNQTCLLVFRKINTLHKHTYKQISSRKARRRWHQVAFLPTYHLVHQRRSKTFSFH